jgi:hypothetical protein
MPNEEMYQIHVYLSAFFNLMPQYPRLLKTQPMNQSLLNRKFEQNFPWNNSWQRTNHLACLTRRVFKAPAFYHLGTLIKIIGLTDAWLVLCCKFISRRLVGSWVDLGGSCYDGQSARHQFKTTLPGTYSTRTVVHAYGIVYRPKYE